MTERENPAAADLDTKSTRQILGIINREDRKVAPAVGRVIPQIGRAVDLSVEALSRGGRLVYLGAGSSGRLGVLDAAECLPTFGAEEVVAVMAGAPQAMLRPTEPSEDDSRQVVRDLRRIRLNRKDVLLGISASGSTPYVLGGMKYARTLGSCVVALTANPGAQISRIAEVTIAPVAGPEVIAGSTRMKAGTAQKLVLNMISTAVMVRLGRVFSNWMIGVRPANEKLRRRAAEMVARAASVSLTRARDALERSGGSPPVALLMLWKQIGRRDAERLLASGASTASVLRAAEKQRASGDGKRRQR